MVSSFISLASDNDELFDGLFPRSVVFGSVWLTINPPECTSEHLKQNFLWEHASKLP